MKIVKKYMLLSVLLMGLLGPLGGCVKGSTVENKSANENVTTPTPAPSSSLAPFTTSNIITGQTNIFDLLVGPGLVHVFWTEKVGNNGSVQQANLDGTAEKVLASGSQSNLPWGVWTDGTTVWWTNNLPVPQGALMAVPRGGGAVTTIATGLNKPAYVTQGSDGLLYVTENVASDGRVLRFDPTLTNQTRDSGTWISGSANAPPPYRIHIFNVNNVETVFYTCMTDDLTSGNQGQIRSKPTSAASGTITGTTLIATGLLNPTDVTVDETAGVAYWTEYDQANGSVRSIPVGAAGGRGSIVNLGPDTVQPPASILLGTFLNTGATALAVTRNNQQANGGTIVIIDPVSGTTNAAQGATGNFPYGITTDGTSIFVGEFNFTQGAEALSTQPSGIDVFTQQ